MINLSNQSYRLFLLFQYQDGVPSSHKIFPYFLTTKTVVTEGGHQDHEDEEGLGHMTAKPLKNGRKYVDSGFVHDMMDTKTEEHYFMKAHM